MDLSAALFVGAAAGFSAAVMLRKEASGREGRAGGDGGASAEAAPRRLVGFHNLDGRFSAAPWPARAPTAAAPAALPELVFLSCQDIVQASSMDHCRFGADALDDTSMMEILDRRGVKLAQVDWMEARDYTVAGRLDWSGVRVAVVRTTWDYSASLAQCEAFVDFLDTIAGRGVRVLNSPALVRWNAFKDRYLPDLRDRVGIPVVPVVPLLRSARAASLDLSQLLRARGWEKGLVKPAVGAGSRGTLRVSLRDPESLLRAQALVYAVTGVVAPMGRRVDVENGKVVPTLPLRRALAPDEDSVVIPVVETPLTSLSAVDESVRPSAGASSASSSSSSFSSSSSSSSSTSTSSASSSASSPTLHLVEVGIGHHPEFWSGVHEDMLLCPYYESVETVGELSAIVVDGQVISTIRKVPLAGDYKVQGEHGGREEPTVFTADEEALVQRILRDVPECVARVTGGPATGPGAPETLFCRLDFLRDGSDGPLHVLEVEAIEPCLYFRANPESAGRLASAIEARLRGAK